MKDVQREKWFEAWGVPYEYREGVPLEDFDAEASLRNQARGDAPLDQQLVDEYVIALRGGAEFPAVIAWPSGTRLVLCGGNHRLAAMRRCRVKHTDAYVLRTQDPVIIQSITAQDNLRCGKRQDQKTNMVHALDAVERLGTPITKAAAAFGLTVAALKHQLGEQRMRQRIGSLGLDPRPFTGRMMDILAGVANDNVLRQVVAAVQRHGLDAEEARTLVRDVQGARTEADAEGLVQAFVARPEIASRGTTLAVAPAVAKRRKEAFRFASGLRNLLAKHRGLRAELVPSDEEALSNLLDEITTLWSCGEVGDAAAVGAMDEATSWAASS